MVTQLAQKIYTPKEYLELETQSTNRNEFINGDILPMAGGTTQHNEIVTNLCIALKPPLRQKGGRVYIENVKLSISEFNMFTYPDVMVIEKEPIYYNESKTTVTNPIIIFEVLSDSTREYDQSRKFTFYRSLESLQEYVLVEPEQNLIMVYRRNNNKTMVFTNFRYRK
jgi:Uma2 family endonuclease